jgi:ribosomal protein S18 acetylase RimI-like enzyme
LPDARPDIGQLLSKVAARARARGLAEVASLGAHRIREMASSRGGLIVLSRATGGEPPVTEGYTFRAATAADAHRYARDVGTDSARTFAARLSDATRCYVVEHEGRLLHSTWITTAAAWTREIHRYFRPPSGDAYIYESYTRAEARGRGLYPFALANIAAAEAAAGIRRLWVAVEEDNAASLRAVTKGGFEESFRVAFARRFGRLQVVEATGEPGHPCPGCITTSV